MLNLLLSLSLSHTGHWKFNMAPHAGVILGFFEWGGIGGAWEKSCAPTRVV